MRLNSVAIIICFLLSFSSELVYSQTRIDSLRIKLNELSNTSPTLNDKIDLAVDGVSIGEFLRGIGSSYKLNINVDPNLNAIIYNNFNNLSVKDLLVFVCDNYKLDIKFFGPIMSFIPYVEPQKKMIAP